MQTSVRAGLAVCGLFAVCGAPVAAQERAAAGHWPQFRGPSAAGVADGRPLPTSWNVETGENVLWKVATPGLGYSSPAIWGDRIYLTMAVASSEPQVKVGLYGSIEPVDESFPHQFRVRCLERATGKPVWEEIAYEGVPKVKRHPKASHANSTPAVDAERVVAFFGSEGLHCYDHDGKLLWKRDFGVLDSGYYVVPAAQWGFASSPVLYDGKVIVLADVQKGSFLAVLDAKNGEDIWRVERKDVPTWGTPTVVRVGDQTHVVINGYRHSGAYDLADGREVWKLSGGGDIPVPTPVVADDLIFLTSAHGPAAPIYAIRTSAKGDISLASGATQNEHVVWSNLRRGNYMQTPIVYRGMLFMCMDNGVATCYDAKSGEQKWRKRLGEGTTGFTASAVAGDGKVYFTSEEGDIHVVRAAPEFEELGRNAMGEVAMATPAVADSVLYIRTQYHLWAIGAR